MTEILALAIPVTVTCVLVAIIVVAIMRYKCPRNRPLSCCPESADCCPDDCPDSVLPQSIVQTQNLKTGELIVDC